MQFFFEPKREHWVATTYLEGEVTLYDSKVNGSLSRSLEQQICQIYQGAIVDGNLLVLVVFVQQQTGCTECGVMAIANGYHAIRRDDLLVMSFAYDLMREHLSQCLKNDCFTPFPVSQTNQEIRRTSDVQHINIEVNCDCHQPDSYDDMICCDGCDNWIHLHCAGLTNVPDGNWFCSNCN